MFGWDMIRVPLFLFIEICVSYHKTKLLYALFMYRPFLYLPQSLFAHIYICRKASLRLLTSAAKPLRFQRFAAILLACCNVFSVFYVLQTVWLSTMGMSVFDASRLIEEDACIATRLCWIIDKAHFGMITPRNPPNVPCWLLLGFESSIGFKQIVLMFLYL